MFKPAKFQIRQRRDQPNLTLPNLALPNLTLKMPERGRPDPRDG